MKLIEKWKFGWYGAPRNTYFQWLGNTPAKIDLYYFWRLALCPSKIGPNYFRRGGFWLFESKKPPKISPVTFGRIFWQHLAQKPIKIIQISVVTKNRQK
jgi:hypothetical protein